MARLEEPAKEVARLAAHPEGSLERRLSRLPVNFEDGDVWHQLIELPHLEDEPQHTVVVVPVRGRGDGRNAPWQRHQGAWECAVIASDDPSYVVRGYPLGAEKVWIREDILARGTRRDLL